LLRVCGARLVRLQRWQRGLCLSRPLGWPPLRTGSLRWPPLRPSSLLRLRRRRSREAPVPCRVMPRFSLLLFRYGWSLFAKEPWVGWRAWPRLTARACGAELPQVLRSLGLARKRRARRRRRRRQRRWRRRGRRASFLLCLSLSTPCLFLPLRSLHAVLHL